jgi:hypothetical protein
MMARELQVEKYVGPEKEARLLEYFRRQSLVDVVEEPNQHRHDH